MLDRELELVLWQNNMSDGPGSLDPKVQYTGTYVVLGHVIFQTLDELTEMRPEYLHLPQFLRKHRALIQYNSVDG
jgi:hypothetical protein